MLPHEVKKEFGNMMPAIFGKLTTFPHLLLPNPNPNKNKTYLIFFERGPRKHTDTYNNIIKAINQ